MYVCLNSSEFHSIQRLISIDLREKRTLNLNSYLFDGNWTIKKVNKSQLVIIPRCHKITN